MASKRSATLSVRMTERGYEQIGTLAEQHETDRATVARILFAVALKHPREVEQLLEAQS